MKTIRLLTLTSLSYLLIFTFLLFVSFWVFLRFLQLGVNESTDELLINKKNRIVRLFQATEEPLPLTQLALSDYFIQPVDENIPEYPVFRDTLITDKSYDESYMYRKLSALQKINNVNYRIDIVLPLVEKDDVVQSVVVALILVFVIIVVVFYLSSLVLSKRIFIPFHTTLQRLRNFEVDKSLQYIPVDSKIQEFTILNKAISDLTARAQESFANQKTFIENASHELLTPIAVSQNKLEELASDADLTAHQSGLITVLINVNQRMSRLNKTLLLLSKIENGQFPERQTIWVRELVDDILLLFEEQQDEMKLSVSVMISKNVTIKANLVLAELLVTNLIKNAFIHNNTGGEILITFLGNRLTVSNTSKNPAIPEEYMYQRFYKNSQRKESWGLGLAIVKKICELNQWAIQYRHTKGRHVFEIVIQ